MKIEHVALLVEKPVELVRWYERHLGMKAVRSGGAPSFTHFLADSSGQVLLEVYRNDHLPLPDYRGLDPLLLHVAFATDRVDEERARLVQAGASAAGEVEVTPLGDRVAMLRDPWGLAIQLVHRRERMLAP